MSRLSVILLMLMAMVSSAMADSSVSIDDVIRAGLPVVFINTVDEEEPTYETVTHPEGSFGESITNNKKVPCRIVIVNAQDTLYDSGDYLKDQSGATIKVNGNTSAYYSKNKPYKIKLQKKADLLYRHDSDCSDKEWRLLRDGITLNTIIGLKISQLMGLEWTPAYQPCNVVINGDYRGCYLLIESVKRNPACRLNVDKEDGYIVERDAYWWNEERYFCTDFFSNHNYYRWTWKYPDKDNVTISQQDYITDYINQAEHAIADGTYDQYIDISSFASWLLAHDILGTWDSGGSNTFVTKYDNTDGCLLKMGNLWDFDSNFWMPAGQFSRLHTSDYDFYFHDLFNSSNKAFTKAYKEKWMEIRDWLPTEIKTFLNSFTDSDTGKALQTSRNYYYKRWQERPATVSADVSKAIRWFDSHLPLLGEAIIALDDHDTGINDIHPNSPTADRIYNLNGQTINHPQSGIYIIQGRKVILPRH